MIYMGHDEANKHGLIFTDEFISDREFPNGNKLVDHVITDENGKLIAKVVFGGEAEARRNLESRCNAYLSRPDVARMISACRVTQENGLPTWRACDLYAEPEDSPHEYAVFNSIDGTAHTLYRNLAKAKEALEKHKSDIIRHMGMNEIRSYESIEDSYPKRRVRAQPVVEGMTEI